MNFRIGDIVKLKSNISISPVIRGAFVEIVDIHFLDYNSRNLTMGIKFLKQHGFFTVGETYVCSESNLEVICGKREKLE